MAVVYPANIFLTMFYISAYSAVFFHVVTTNVVMRNPSIDNLRIDANLYGQQETSNVQQGVGNISFLSYKTSGICYAKACQRSIERCFIEAGYA